MSETIAPIGTNSAPPKASGLAIWSLVLGILSLVCFSIFAAIPGVICGHMALLRIKRSGGDIVGKGRETSHANHSTGNAMKLKRWDGFSATNASQSEAKLAYVRLNSQTPCPPRGAVPVNQGCCRRLFHSRHPDRLRSWLRPPQLCQTPW